MKIKLEAEEPEIPETEEQTIEYTSDVDDAAVDAAIAKATTEQQMPVKTELDASAVDGWDPPTKYGTVVYSVSMSLASGIGGAIVKAGKNVISKVTSLFGGGNKTSGKAPAKGTIGLAKAKGT